MDIDIICFINDLLFNLYKMFRVFCNFVEIESRLVIIRGLWEEDSLVIIIRI